VNDLFSLKYNKTPLLRLTQAAWHDVIVELSKAERLFRENGHTREADQAGAYVGTMTQHAVRHLDRIAGSNGHHKDSTVVTELPALSVALEDSTVNGQAPTDMTGASEGGGSEEPEHFPGASDDAAAAPSSGVVLRQSLTLAEQCELRMVQVSALMKTGTTQQLEVALKFFGVARGLALKNHPTAQRRYDAAEQVLREQETGT
jgi:hypothetical protein